MLTQRNAVRVGAAFVASVLAAGSADAALVSYDINQPQSTLTIGGSLLGNAPTQQTANSLTSMFSGTIIADRTATRIAFPGGSTIIAEGQGTNFQQPRNDTTPGSQAADYGRRTFVGSPFFVDAFEAFRNVVLDVFDDTEGAGTLISGTTFPSTNMGLEFTSGESDVAYGTAGAETDFAFPNQLGNMNTGATASSTISVSGDVETIVLRFNTGPISYSVSSTNDSSVTFNGTIVASRIVPEPAGALALAGAVGGLALRRRVRRDA